MLLNASTRRRSSSADRTAIRASKSPRAMRRVARVSRRTGSAMRSAMRQPDRRRRAGRSTAPRGARRDRARRSRARSRAGGAASGTVRMASLSGRAHRRRGDACRGTRRSRSSSTKLGSRSQHDRAIDVVRRARRQQARREQVALARRDQLGAVEDVDVLIDHLADPDHHVVAQRARSPRLLRREAARRDSSMTRCATAAVRAASASTSSRSRSAK